MASQPSLSYGDTFCVEPGDLSSSDANTVECHCEYEHEACAQLTEDREICLCQQFLLFQCDSEMEVSEQIWIDLLSSKLEGFPSSDYWGCGAFLESLTGEDYVYTVVIRVRNRDDRDKIFNRIDRQFIHLQSEEFDGDDSLWLYCSDSCCVQGFFEKFDIWEHQRGVFNFTFGNELVLRDVQSLNADRLAVSALFMNTGEAS